MSNEVSIYNQGSGLEATRKQDRLAVRTAESTAGLQAERMRLRVKLAAKMIDGSMALAAHAMERAQELDTWRQMLAEGDPIAQSMLADFQAIAVRQTKMIQAHLWDD